MKRMTLFLFVIFCANLYAQSNFEIASVYFKKAEESYGDIKIKESVEYFNKGMGYLDSIRLTSTARLGMLIYYEDKNFNEAKKFAKHYFSLATDRNSEEYQQLLELYIINEEEIVRKEKALLKKIEKELKESQAQIEKAKELRKIDSLKSIWKDKSNALSLKVDSIYTFDKNNLALFTKGEYFGLMDDYGSVVIKANEYKKAFSFDSYFIFMNEVENPTKIYCYKSNSKSGFQLPEITTFNVNATHYGQVMLPRANARLITYPDNISNVLIFDLEERKFVSISNLVDLLKQLKKADKIAKYKKEGKVKIAGEWYRIAGHLGRGFHPLFFEDNSQVYSYFNTTDAKMYQRDDYNYIGAFYNKKAQVIKGEEVYWVNDEGKKTKEPKSESGVYTGNTKIVKLESGRYQFQKKTKEGKLIFLKDKNLVDLARFIKGFKGK